MLSCVVLRRERAWKLKQAKRFTRAVKSSRLDVESRAEVRPWLLRRAWVVQSTSRAGFVAAFLLVASIS